MNCPFCQMDRQPISENASAISVSDGFPVSPGHALVIPRRHVETIFELTEIEWADCFALVKEVKLQLERQHGTSAFNIGINCGVVAGQTVPHAHIHVIPRYPGDVEDPRGGVRHVIPGKGYY